MSIVELILTPIVCIIFFYVIINLEYWAYKIKEMRD